MKKHRVVRGHPGDEDYGSVDIRKEIERNLKTERIHTTEYLSDDYAFLAGKTLKYIELSFLNEDDNSLKLAEDFLYQYNLEIEFENLYGEKFTFDTHKHTRDKCKNRAA